MPDPIQPTKPPRPPSRKNPRHDRKEDVLVKDRVARPKKYKVLLHNDDFTPMEFVVEVLEGLFHKSPAEATRIMLHVHRNGVGIAGVYAREVAESKADKTIKAARDAGFPLMASTEPDSEGPGEHR
ncbi:MAG: ATP-dependent Clp protease adaptor ClpS [Alphaproteobacteria bacterium]|nr:ATP-dependent Clp protease adaptor ClpS [Alphaproteobacteria bacterium]